MNRSHLALILLIGAPVAIYALVVPPNAKPPTAPEFFPTTVGTKWVYRYTEYGPTSNASFDEVEVITRATENKETRSVIVQKQSGRLHEYSVSKSSLMWRSLGDHWQIETQPDEWSTLLPGHVAPGESWVNTDASSRNVNHVIGWEIVRVPTGAYRALRVDVQATEHNRAGCICTINEPPRTYTCTTWRVPGIGPVKADMSLSWLPLRYRYELVSFTPGPR